MTKEGSTVLRKDLLFPITTSPIKHQKKKNGS